MITHVDVDDTVWPVDISTGDEDSSQWVLRYGTPELREKQRLSVASLVSAYGHLLDPSITMKDATDALRRARRAASSCYA